jgi:WD40 repeat protein
MISPANICRIIDLKGNTIKEFRWKVDYSWNVGFGSWWPRQLLLDSLGNEIKYYTWHKSYINSAGFSKDRKYVITASDDSTAKIWDLKGNEILSLKGHNNKVIDATFSGDGEKIVTVTIDNTLRIWDKKGQLLTIIKGPKESVRYAIFSSDNTKIETQSLLDTCRVYDLKGKMLEKVPWDRIYISSVYFSSDGKKLLTASRDGTSKLWDLETAGYIELDESPYASFSPDEKYIATISDWDHISLWDSRGNKLLSFPIQDETINSVKFSPDGKFILTSCGKNGAKILDLKGNEIHSFKGTGEKVLYASFSPDGKYIVTANDDNSIQIWLIDSQSILNNIKNNPDSRNTWKLNIEAKQKYNIDLNYFENRLEDSHLCILSANSENDTIQKIKYFVRAIDFFDYVLKVAKDSLPQNETIKIKNEVSNVYKELAIISLYKRDFKGALNYAQSGLIINPANGLLLVYKAISLLYDNQFDKTKEIILTLKDKPVETGNEDYNIVILNILNNLENKGIKHDDLLKLKLLITN